MDRNEKARKDMINNKAAQNERDDKMRDAIAEITRALPVLKEILKHKKADFEIHKKVQEIVLSKPNKITPDFEYEADIEYQKLMVERQLILNNLTTLEKQNDIDKLAATLKEHNETLVSYKAQLNFMEGE